MGSEPVLINTFLEIKLLSQINLKKTRLVCFSILLIFCGLFYSLALRRFLGTQELPSVPVENISNF